MAGLVTIELRPAGIRLQLPQGTSLHDRLVAQQMEFPCGGCGRCRGCRIRVLHGHLPASDEDRELLGTEATANGWRLACRARAVDDLVLEVAQWQVTVLGDEQAVPVHPRDDLAIAIDLGTTTIVAQLLDRATGNILGVRSALNAQGTDGADVMTRLDFAVHHQGAGLLTHGVRDQLGGLVKELVDALPQSCPRPPVGEILVVGNTVMHHLFCGMDVEPLSRHPFETQSPDLQEFTASELDWSPRGARVRFLPCLGSFVGSDILAGILATGLDTAASAGVLVDLGTNGEIVVGNRDRLLVASTAAGPAFEGARISIGMRAMTGAIAEVHRRDHGVECAVIGGGLARGLCGSGLVDAVAAGLDLGWVTRSGRLTRPNLPLTQDLALQPRDVRELQLAKAAIAAGLELLVRRWRTRLEDLVPVHLAGAFGNYVRQASARRIGLLPSHIRDVNAAGNTALRGARQILLGPPSADLQFADLRRRVESVPLAEDPEFLDAYVRAMHFP